MSRTYNYKPENRPKNKMKNRAKRVELTDYEIEFIEMSIGPSIRLKA